MMPAEPIEQSITSILVLLARITCFIIKDTMSLIYYSMLLVSLILVMHMYKIDIVDQESLKLAQGSGFLAGNAIPFVLLFHKRKVANSQLTLLFWKE